MHFEGFPDATSLRREIPFKFVSVLYSQNRNREEEKKKGEEEEVAAVHNPFVPPPSVVDRPRRCSSSPSATLEIGKEDEVSRNIGSGSMFAWVCSWSVWIVGKAVNNFLKKMGISLHFHP
ncbi:uncharacterized protein LOC127149322 isoform X2 [Cucumis melo]|uniref:Uncharacterized protein LOC127149322 isoform X2 n=1 Tax=Cucumis melo TaxID=3656 RepID=A0ABM3KRQ1_CUCME|nr:uncharacterized protein LOC127149322 isoform X2 [Cucumis melo]